MKHTLESLNITRYISDNINNQTMHHHYHILYDIANSYNQKQQINYVEIGCYAGGSACLMLQRPNTNVVSIDIGMPISKEIVYENVKRLNKFNNSYTYLMGNSQTGEMVTRLSQITTTIDILFIDGDHSYQSVINDFTLYERMVSKNGYIVFDDYNDPTPVHNTSAAVNDIVKKEADRYNIIGTLDNIYGARPDTLHDGNCFIIQKK